jgi:micrococcal nuclease
MASKRDNVVSFRKPFRAVPLRRSKKRPSPPPKPIKPLKSWRDAWFETRPFLLLIALLTVFIIAATPGAYELPAFLQSKPEQISGNFTRCGMGRGYYCVIDGDTFRIGERSVRVVGIDTAEVDARCPAEAEQAERSTSALQSWLNRGPFQMTARVDQPGDQYGRELRILKRVAPDKNIDRLADWMQTNGGARDYLGGWRGGWC